MHLCVCVDGWLAGFGIRRTVDGQPLVLILALGQLHHLAQAPSTQCCLGILAKLVARSATLARDSGSELVLRPVVAIVVRWLALFLMLRLLGPVLGADPRGLLVGLPTTKHGRRGDEGRYNRRGSIVQKLATTEINSTHTVVRKELMARTGSLDFQKDVPELRRPGTRQMLAGQSLMTQLAGARSTTAAQAESGFRVRGCAPMQAEAEAGDYPVDAVAGLDGCGVLVVEDDAARVGEKVEGRKSTMHQCGGTEAECLHCDWQQQPPD